MSIHQGHRERVRQEFLSGGLEHFSDVRALELLLFYSRLQGDVNPLAHRLLETFGSLAGVIDAPPEALSKIPGVGENTIVLLKLIPAIFARYLDARNPGKQTLSGNEVDVLKTIFAPRFVGAQNEKVYIACFDNNRSLLGVRFICEGTPSASEVVLRTLLKEALFLNATMVVLAHNHPAGEVLPSEEDGFLTRYLKTQLAPTGIVLYDHLIFNEREVFSFRANRSPALWSR